MRRTLLLLATAAAVTAAPPAVDFRRLDTPTWQPVFLTRALDWVLCDSPAAWVADAFLSERSSAAVLNFLESLLLPASHNLSCGRRSEPQDEVALAALLPLLSTPAAVSAALSTRFGADSVESVVPPTVAAGEITLGITLQIDTTECVQDISADVRDAIRESAPSALAGMAIAIVQEPTADCVDASATTDRRRLDDVAIAVRVSMRNLCVSRSDPRVQQVAVNNASLVEEAGCAMSQVLLGANTCTGCVPMGDACTKSEECSGRRGGGFINGLGGGRAYCNGDESAYGIDFSYPVDLPDDRYLSGNSCSGKCFPSRGAVTLVDGRAAPMSDLRAGDRILAARADGTLFHDTVSRFSLVQNDVKATFVSLATNGELGPKTLTLTGNHHVPVGPSRSLKVAADVAVGEAVWIAHQDKLVAQTVRAVDVVVDTGLHSPVLVHGGYPIVDGVATSFEAAPIVALVSYVLPIVEGFCAATGTCDSVRKVKTAVECAAKHIIHAHPVCNTYHYIDGAVADGTPAVTPATLGVATLAVAAAAIWSAQKRKMNA